MSRKSRAFRAATERFTPGDSAKADAIADLFARFDTALTHHHEGEERRLWPVLRANPNDVAEVDHLTHEHEEIVTALSRARAAFAALRTDPGADQARAAGEATATVRAAAADHFAHEEREMDELCARADPATLGPALRQMGRDAGFGEAMWFMQWVSDGATPAQHAFLRRLIPPPVH